MIENMFGDEIKKILGLKTGIAAALEREIGVTARVTFVEPMALHKTPDGRVRRVVDNR